MLLVSVSCCDCFVVSSWHQPLLIIFEIRGSLSCSLGNHNYIFSGLHIVEARKHRKLELEKEIMEMPRWVMEVRPDAPLSHREAAPWIKQANWTARVPTLA